MKDSRGEAGIDSNRYDFSYDGEESVSKLPVAFTSVRMGFLCDVSEPAFHSRTSTVLFSHGCSHIAELNTKGAACQLRVPPMPMPPPSERLVFREWALDDVEAFHSICSDPRVMQYVGDGQPWTRATTLAFIEGAMARWERLGYCRWPVIHAADRRLIGFCGFIEADGGAEIGWRLSADYWGRGLATEAARAVLKYGFETLGFQRVSATVQAGNRSSLRVVEKLGMRPERYLQRNGREIIAFAVENREKRQG